MLDSRRDCRYRRVAHRSIGVALRTVTFHAMLRPLLEFPAFLSPYSPNCLEKEFSSSTIPVSLIPGTCHTPAGFLGKGAPGMHVLKIEYPVADYDAWKAAFDRDALDREGPGVRRYRVLRPTDDPGYVMIDLDFDNASEAEAYLGALRRAVLSQQASPVSGEPQTRIVEVVEKREY